MSINPGDLDGPVINIEATKPLVGSAMKNDENGVAGFYTRNLGPHIGTRPAGNGVYGESNDSTASGVSGVNVAGGVGVAGDSHEGRGIGILGRGVIAGRFEGNVEVTGDI